jgi:hypothetical protein
MLYGCEECAGKILIISQLVMYDGDSSLFVFDTAMSGYDAELSLFYFVERINMIISYKVRSDKRISYFLTHKVHSSIFFMLIPSMQKDMTSMIIGT